MSAAADDGAHLLARLWERYAGEVDHARAFVALTGGAVASDHVAFRALARPGGGVAAFEAVFERFGWRRAGVYQFPDAHLTAVHLSRDGAPRIFLSQLHADALSPQARTLLDRLPADPPPPVGIDALADWFDAPPCPLGAHELAVLDAETQFGAWLAAFGRKVNHFAAAVADIDGWQRRLLAAEVPMKTNVEGAPGSPLRQTATAAAALPVGLADGAIVHRPYAYLELAERRPGFDGFLAPQARQLFDMTRR